MTKAALCIMCSDILAPYRDWTQDRRWRWCQCGDTGVRWRDGLRGLIEVSARYGQDYARVIGISNMFLERAVARQMPGGAWWRQLHEQCAEEVSPHYLFSKENRNCWALVVRVGESGDVTFVDYPTARDRNALVSSPYGEDEPAPDPPPAPA